MLLFRLMMAVAYYADDTDFRRCFHCGRESHRRTRSFWFSPQRKKRRNFFFPTKTFWLSSSGPWTTYINPSRFFHFAFFFFQVPTPPSQCEKDAVCTHDAIWSCSWQKKKNFFLFLTSSLRRSTVIRLQLSVEKAMATNATEITAAIVANESV